MINAVNNFQLQIAENVRGNLRFKKIFQKKILQEYPSNEQFFNSIQVNFLK